MEMSMEMKKGASAIRAALVALSAAAAMSAAPSVYAQLSTATIKGGITQGGTAIHGAVLVTATSKTSGYSYKTTTNSDGSYVLSGLTPGIYEIKIEGGKTETITLGTGETASLDLALPGAEATQTVTIVSSAQRMDVKNSELGTSVTPLEMENLPQGSRNFLAFSDLAPGVRFTTASNGGSTVQSGSQSADNLNVFIDGVGQKNYAVEGGVNNANSPGNPFPQLAVAEYKVTTQNYKAEFDQVSSAAISATTKSGTNEFHGEVFADHTGTGLTAYDPFQLTNLQQNNEQRPNATQNEYGFALGGPIKEDVMHFFIAYEGKNDGLPREVGLPPGESLPNAGIVPSLLAQTGPVTEKFVENLWFAKIDAQIGDDHHVETTVRIRRESNMQPQNINNGLPENDNSITDDEVRFDVKDEWTIGDYLNEARFGYEYLNYGGFGISSSSPQISYFVSPTNSSSNDTLVLQAGDSPDFQSKGQRGFTLADDLTYTGMAGHTFRGGVRFKAVEMNLTQDNQGVASEQELINNTTGIATLIPGTYNAAQSIEKLDYNDNQIGLYFQDDWDVSKKLELNLGLRWDYETNMLDNNFVLPAGRVQALLNSQNTTAGAPPGQTYAQALALGGININDYISNGNNRPNFTGAYQPRLGFSYDVNGDKSTVVFGGWGRAYDRTVSDYALSELSHDVAPSGEYDLIKNNHAMPYTDQFSMGLRQAAGRWNLEAGASSSVSRNQFNWFCGNRAPDGSLGAGFNPNNTCDWGNPPPTPVGGTSTGTLVLGDFTGGAKTQTLYLKAEKPYTIASGWQLGATFTLSNASNDNSNWTSNNVYNWLYGVPGYNGWHPSGDVEKDRLIVSGFTDRLLPYSIMVSGKVTLGSGLPYQVVDCVPASGCVFEVGNASPFHQFDLGLSKDFTVPKGKIVLRADILNLFNTANYGGYNNYVGMATAHPVNSLGGDNPGFGLPSNVIGPMRTVKIGLRYVF